MKKHVRTTSSEKGFTIVELMIATSVLSVILLLVTTMMIGIGVLFAKGVNQAKVQDAVRSTVDEISQQLELTSQKPDRGTQNIGGVLVNIYCIGSNRYSYVQNIKIGTGGLQHVLWRDNPKAGCQTDTAANLTIPSPNIGGDATNGTELVTPNSRLTAFCIGTLAADGSTCTYNFVSPYTISIGIAYGDDDLLNLAGINSTCNGVTGQQFCATSSLSTTVANRLPNGVQ
jgi:prepilin-type N-terminal cleavage/methylation domain-containing protein